jgi:hypothetical protein
MLYYSRNSECHQNDLKYDRIAVNCNHRLHKLNLMENFKYVPLLIFYVISNPEYRRFEVADSGRTSIMIRHIPNMMKAIHVMEVIDNHGYKGK